MKQFEPGIVAVRTVFKVAGNRLAIAVHPNHAASASFEELFSVPPLTKGEIGKAFPGDLP